LIWALNKPLWNLRFSFVQGDIIAKRNIVTQVHVTKNSMISNHIEILWFSTIRPIKLKVEKRRGSSHIMTGYIGIDSSEMFRGVKLTKFDKFLPPPKERRIFEVRRPMLNLLKQDFAKNKIFEKIKVNTISKWKKIVEPGGTTM
jgi:hypothetical protein